MSAEQTPGDDPRDVRRGQILNELFDRRARGDSHSEAETLAADPELAGEMGEYLQLLRELEGASGQLDALIAQRVLTKSADPRYPAKLGAYKITGYVGRGGMGVVLKAYEESLNRTVALKILRPEMADNKAALTRFEREAKAAAALRHPNIVTVYAVGHERGVPFIAMEYVDGPSLADVVRGTAVAPDLRVRRTSDRVESPPYPLPTEMIRRIFRELLSALDAAHKAGLIHRDVKSSNILLEEGSGIGDRGSGSAAGLTSTRQGRPPTPDPRPPIPAVKLADFGLARMRSSQTQLTLRDSVLGTPEYMSPEQARGDSDIDHRTDLYSAGVVLYEMLTGRTPFKADTPTATIRRILDEDPAHPRTITKDVDPNLASLALRLMAKRPEDRVWSASEVISLLDAEQRVPLSRRRRRLPRRLALGVLVLAMLVAGAWWRSHFTRGPSTPATAQPAEAILPEFKVDEERSPTTVQVRRRPNLDWETFHQFPEEVRLVRDVESLDLDGNGKLAVVAALDTPLGGSNVIALDVLADELWRLDLSATSGWPGSPPDLPWQCVSLTAGELDGEPGDELLAVATHPKYCPTRISIVDSRGLEPRVRSTFWHRGKIADPRMEPDFFGHGKAAILGWGFNNVLCIADEFSSDAKRHRAHWEFVPVFMILDPAHMDGLGPVPADYMPDFPRAGIYAYAFLDLPGGPRVPYVPDDQARQTQTRYPKDGEPAVITEIRDARYPVGDAAAEPDQTRPWFTLVIKTDQAAGPGRAELTVDRDLELKRVTIITGEVLGEEEEYWRNRWHRIIQKGEDLRH